MTEQKTKNIAVFVLTGLVGLYLFNPHARSKQEELADYMTYSSDYGSQEVAMAQQGRAPSSIKDDSSLFIQVPKINLSLADLEKKFGSPLKIEKSNNELRLMGQIPVEKKPSESPDEALGRLVSDISSVMDIDHPEQLKSLSQTTTSTGTVSSFQQVFDGYAVEGSQVRVHQDVGGHVFMVHSTFLSGLKFIDTTLKVPAVEAVKIATTDAANLDPQNRKPEISPAVLVIHRFTENKADLSWKIVTHQPWLLSHATEVYFVSAHQPSVFERVAPDKP